MSLTVTAEDLVAEQVDYLRHALAMGGVMSPGVGVAARTNILSDFIAAGVFARTEDRIVMYRLTTEARRWPNG